MPPDSSADDGWPMSRRSFLIGSGTLAGSALLLAGGAYVAGDGDVRLDHPLRGDRDRTTTPPADGTSYWLGPDLWGNRLQDWRHHEGRIECLTGERDDEVRTAALLTREIVDGDRAGHLRVTVGIAGGPSRNGFCGVLLGTGTDGAGPGSDFDHRRAALVQRGSGTGGGTLCTFGTDGRVRFREHTDGKRPLAFAPLDADTSVPEDGPHPPGRGEAVQLALDIVPRGAGRFDVLLRALDPGTGRELAAGVRRDVPGSALRGGVSLVSSPPAGEPGSRWWFEDIETTGEKIETHPDRELGPVLGTLFSVDDDTLKLTAQLLPVGDAGERSAWFEYRPAAGDGAADDWRRGGTEPIEDGYIARFRLDDWDATRAWDYRVGYESADGRTWTYEGEIPSEPTREEGLTLALFSCTKPAGSQLETGDTSSPIPGQPPLGKFTSRNVYFPHSEVVENTRAQDPDVLVFAGDQLYEENPTPAESHPDPQLDYLYKWYLWLWAFRALTRDRPSFVLVDDHDVYQPNIWGRGGQGAGEGRIGGGGYRASPTFVNRAQRIQCGHNPDPADDRPVERDIEVYYTTFSYGGVSFALLEDRKFKSPPGAPTEQLLGDRQLSLLREWGETDTDEPRVCLTQTVFACAHTTPEGDPMRDYDSNGFPKAGRDRAVEALRDAGALVLSGDQHLGTLLRHGLETHTDAVVQFSGPQTGATFQRWFEPGDLPDDAGQPHTGAFTDTFGNPYRMLAVANPEISFAEFRQHRAGGQTLVDRDLRSDGYGIVHVDHEDEAFRIECWPWDADPDTSDDQFDGWPYRLPFEATDGRR